MQHLQPKRSTSKPATKRGLSRLFRRTRIVLKERTRNPAFIETFRLQREKDNPILCPNASNRWESDAVFNSAALYLNGKVHFIYRAIGESGLSVFGYAASNDGTRISERSSEPVFVSDDIEPAIAAPYPYSSGGSWWGAEDPRMTRVGDTIYMTYTAFNGCSPPCVALTSIAVADFQDKKWNWDKPRIISQPGVTNKNWVLFPEKINGSYAVLHSITPEIQIDYRNTLQGLQDIRSTHYTKGRDHNWDNWVRGVGPPPIRTRDGWLVFYHAMDRRDPDRYKIGAMLLDSHHPEKVLFRSKAPLLEPDLWYENNGHKKGVVYACGAALIGNTLHLYYGGSDCYLCASEANIGKLLDYLKGGRENPLQARRSKFKSNVSFRTH